MSNYFDSYDWSTMINLHPLQNYNIQDYFEIICPPSEYPSFIDKYLSLPMLTRLKDVGLLCGTDWTALYKNRLYYSRFDHSKGVALITWHFTKDKAQTLAALFHDVSTPVFSHVSDFRKGDALTQTATEETNSSIIKSDPELYALLKTDDLTIEQIQDYHIYPIADNEIPCLSADRLEYMFPSGMALDGSWNMEEIKRCYNDIIILKDENGTDELGFKTQSIALEYCRHFCLIGHILQLNENKLTLNLLGKIMNQAVAENILQEEDFMKKSEKQIIQILDSKLKPGTELYSLYNTFTKMTCIKHTENPLENHYCVNLKVKQRYINPLVLQENKKAVRLSKIDCEAKKIIDDFLSYTDTPYGCVKLL